MFGAGGGTTSYAEVEETDLILLWGANPRENHPIFFHRVLKAVHAGARLVTIDPRRTSSAEWADTWLGLNVGTDVALANGMAREILHAGLANRDFITRATAGFEQWAASIEPFTLDHTARETGLSPTTIRDVAHAYARAQRAVICWTLGITEHHNAVDNVLSLINLSLLTGHVGRYGSGLSPLRGQNNVQGGGDMGAIPNRMVGFQDVLDPATCARFEAEWGTSLPRRHGKNLTQMFEAMEHGEMTGLFVIGENPAQSEADQHRIVGLLKGLDHLVVQDIFLTKTAELADVVLPAAASWCEADGTVTNSERRVQRVRKALESPGEARDELWILAELARRLGHDWGAPTPEGVWNEVRRLAPAMFGGMTYGRLEAHHGLQWPCPDEQHPGTLFLHGRLWEEPRVGPPAPFSLVTHELPVEMPDDAYPYLLTTGRRLDSYNTGVQTAGYDSPLRREESLDLSPEDAQRLGVRDGDLLRVSSRRGTLVAPARIDHGLRAGLVFMTLHFQDDVRVNQLTIDATDPRSGTAEFKACAVRLDRATPAPAASDAPVASGAGVH